MTIGFLQVFVSPHPALDAVVKMTALILVACALDLVIVGRNPRWRVLLWRTALVAVLLIPFLVFLAPVLEVPVAGGRVDGGFTMADPGRARPQVGVQATPLEIKQASTSANAGPDQAGSIPSETPRDSFGRTVVSLTSVLTQSAELQGLCVGIWAVGVFVLGVVSASAQQRVSRVVRSAEEAPRSARGILRSVAHHQRVAPLPLLRLSHSCVSPFLTGLRRPTLLLPARLIESPNRRDLRAVFAHEMSHVASRDLHWQALANTVCCLFWFHPLLWLARRRHVDACEALSDAVAAESIGDVSAYSGALARMALEQVALLPSSCGIPMARNPRIIGRVRRLERGLNAPSLRRGPVLGALATAAVIVLPVGSVKLVQAREQQIAGAPPPAAAAYAESQTAPTLPSIEGVTVSRDALLDSLAGNVQYLPMGYVPPQVRNSAGGMGGFGTTGDTPDELKNDPETQAVLEGLRAKLREAGREILPEMISISSQARADYYLNMPYKTRFDDDAFNDLAIRVFLREWLQEIAFEKSIPPMSEQEKSAVAVSVDQTLGALETLTKQRLNQYYPSERTGKQFDDLRSLARTMMKRQAPPTAAFRTPIDAEARARVTAEYDQRLQDSLGTIDAHLTATSRNREAPEGVPDRLAGEGVLRGLTSDLLNTLAQSTTDATLDLPEPDPALKEARAMRNEMLFRLTADFQMKQPSVADGIRKHEGAF